MDRFEALDRSRGEFERRVQLVGADDWGRPTPCIEWSVRDLANHVVGGCRRYSMLLHGASPDETNALRSLDHLGADPVAAAAAAADEMAMAFREPGALTRVVHHPAGDRSGGVLLDMRIMDFAIHAWDLARALGSDETLDPDLVVLLWDVLSEMGPEMVEKGYFQAANAVLPGDAPLKARVLHITGRRP